MSVLKQWRAGARRRAFTVVAVTVAVGAAGFVGVASSSANSRGSRSLSHSSTGLSAAKAWLATQTATPKWEGPTSSPKPAKNKFVVDIPCDQAALGCSRQGNAFIQAAKLLGWKTQLIDPGGDPQKLQQAFQEAIQEHANGIFCPGCNAHTIGKWLPKAKAAGIEVVDQSGIEQTAGPGKEWDANVLETNSIYAKTEAAYIAVHSGGHAKIMLVNDSEYAEIAAETQQFAHWIKVYCPGCQIASNLNLSVVNVATTFPQQVQATLKANPSITWVAAPYDFVSIYIVQAIDQSGDKGKVNVVGWGGHPQNLAFVKAGNGEVATEAVALEWAGFAAADQMNRLFNGDKPWGGPESTENYAQMLIDSSDLPKNITSFWDGGVNYVAHYKAIWGVK